MDDRFSVSFVALSPPEGGTLVVPVGADLQPSPAAAAMLGPDLVAAIARGAKAERFEGKARSSMTLVPPADAPFDRVLVLGTEAKPGKGGTGPEGLALGAALAGKLGQGRATVILDGHDLDAVAELALGAELRAYRFDRYKTTKPEGDEPTGALHLAFAVADPEAARASHADRAAVAAGVIAARDLVNEPPNVLTPAAFAERLEDLRPLGVEVEVLGLPELEALGMRALLGVSLGSAVPPRVVLMRWRGVEGTDAPIAVVGKGVTFDTGGISIKPSAGMEDMKGDMAGAAAVAGLMRTLALRKAKLDVVGAVGLVENMPDGAAQRPGDIVTAMSGRTIEIINTDAEGRLVLADVLHHVRETYKPRAMVDLATLTGAILVALGQERAGLFSNDDALAAALHAAGEASGERVWRLPMGPEFDKLVDSKFADMKNTGGRHAGSISAAQFLARFVGDTPWAHLDIAGVGFSAKDPEWNRSWGSGWGVRVLDRWLRDAYGA